MTIIELAKEIGRQIQADERYIAVNSAKELIDNDAELQKQIGDFNLAKINLNNALTSEERDQEKVSQLDTEIRALYEKIMNNEHMMLFNEANEEMNSLVTSINNVITNCLNGHDPETADQVTDCGGNCSSCSGCH